MKTEQRETRARLCSWTNWRNSTKTAVCCKLSQQLRMSVYLPGQSFIRSVKLQQHPWPWKWKQTWFLAKTWLDWQGKAYCWLRITIRPLFGFFPQFVQSRSDENYPPAQSFSYYFSNWGTRAVLSSLSKIPLFPSKIILAILISIDPQLVK